MTTQPVVCPSSEPDATTSFTASVFALMRALLAAGDPGVDAGPRLPQARLGDPILEASDGIRSAHIRVDI